MLSSLNEEYDTISSLGAEVVAVNSGSVASHETFCDSLGGCRFPLASDPKREVARLYGAVSEDGETSVRAIYVLDVGGTIIHKVSWYQPGNVGQFMEIFTALGYE